MASQGESSRRTEEPEDSDLETEQYESGRETPPLHPESLRERRTRRRGTPYTRPSSTRETPFSRPSSRRGTPPISRTSSTAPPSLLAPSAFTPISTHPLFTPLDLSNLGIPPSSENAQAVDQFNQHVQGVFPPVEPENPTEPEQAVMATTTEQNGKGEKCRTPKDFDGNEAKYKTWLRMTETYF